MDKYEVIRPWNGVEIGDVLELEKLHPALKSNVRLMRGEAGNETKSRKDAIKARLTDLGIEFKGNLGEEKLAELLPEGELENLFPAE
jgi:hypothetical protein